MHTKQWRIIQSYHDGTYYMDDRYCFGCIYYEYFAGTASCVLAEEFGLRCPVHTLVDEGYLKPDITKDE